MKEKIFLVWALTATLVALGSAGTAGYLYGKQAAAPAVVERSDVLAMTDARGTAATVNRPRSESEGGEAAAPTYTVPDSYAQLPNQWVSENTAKAEGYAILFEPKTREIIVEQCVHQGYQIDQNGEPLPMTGPSCTTALSGAFESFNEDEASVTTRDGRSVLIALEVDRVAEPMMLSLRFEDHRMTLNPGSKNDLMQSFEAQPAIKNQRREYLTILASGDRDRRSSGE